MSTEWLTTAMLADLKLPGLPTTVRSLNRIAANERWTEQLTATGEPLARRLASQGGGWEYHRSLLPTAAQARLAASAARDGDVKSVPAGRGEAWARFERLPDAAKATAAERLAAIDAVEALQAGGMTRSAAVAVIARRQGCSAATVFNWLAAVQGVSLADRLAHLAPRYVGRTAKAECPPEAWELLKADYLRDAGRSFKTCYDLVTRIAKTRGWTLPAAKTLQRRMDAEVPPEVQCLAREGRDALLRRFPAQRRDRSVFHAMEAVNADGHTFDVFVRWPGEATPVRVVMLAIQDLRSGAILAWRIGRSESSELVRLAFGDLFERWGIPTFAYLDNGRAFASKWLTGQMAFRHRFKVKAEEPRGILTQFGVKVRWTTPYHGQAKPIERAFRDLCETIAKHPAFAGAYTGNRPDAKPESYGSRAIPVDQFVQVVDQEIRWHNEKPGRRTIVCGGMQSFQQAFEESYAASAIRRATDEQRRLWLLAAENVFSATVDGSISLLGNRYWSHEVGRLSGQRLTVRFDPDQLHEGVHVYQLDGRYVGQAACIEDVGFNDTEAAKAHARARRRFARATADMLDAERRLGAADVAAAIPSIEGVPAPAPAVVRGMFPAAATRRSPLAEHDESLWDEGFAARVLDLKAEMDRRRA